MRAALWEGAPRPSRGGGGGGGNRHSLYGARAQYRECRRAPRWFTRCRVNRGGGGGIDISCTERSEVQEMQTTAATGHVLRTCPEVEAAGVEPASESPSFVRLRA